MGLRGEWDMDMKDSGPETAASGKRKGLYCSILRGVFSGVACCG